MFTEWTSGVRSQREAIVKLRRPRKLKGNKKCSQISEHFVPQNEHSIADYSLQEISNCVQH